MELVLGLLFWFLAILGTLWFFGLGIPEWSYLLDQFSGIITAPPVTKTLQIVLSTIIFIIGFKNAFKSSLKLQKRISYGIVLLLGIWGIFWTVGFDNLLYLAQTLLAKVSDMKPSKVYYVPAIIIALIILTQQAIKYAKRFFKKLSKNLEKKRLETNDALAAQKRDAKVAIEKAFRFYLTRIEQIVTSINIAEGNNLKHSKRCLELMDLLIKLQGDLDIPRLPQNERANFLTNLKSKTKDLEKILERHKKAANSAIAEEVLKLIEKLRVVIDAVKRQG